jgi:hypothetical protein
MISRNALPEYIPIVPSLTSGIIPGIWDKIHIMNILRNNCRIFRVTLLAALLLSWLPVHAQSGESSRPIDMVIVLDNSCSMFPKEMLVPGCTSYGSDVGFLRITGADIFLARLGFDQENEADYQVGVISMGDKPTLVSPLASLAGKRDNLAAMIANPKPETATRLVPALQLAYDELTTSSNRKEANLPAVVLITDGVPYPPEGQSNTDIENLIKEYPDIPVFLMILKGADSNLDEFDDYVNFWQGMQQTHDNVFVYVIEKPDQIPDTYNTIVGLLKAAWSPPATICLSLSVSISIKLSLRSVIRRALNPVALR